MTRDPFPTQNESRGFPIAPLALPNGGGRLYHRADMSKFREGMNMDGQKSQGIRLESAGSDTGSTCSFCEADADWQVEIPRACIAHACDLHRAVLEVDAEKAGYVTIWRAIRADAGGFAAMSVVFLTPFLVGCGSEPESEWTPLYILAVAFCLATVAAVTVLTLTSLGRRFGVVETRDDVDAERDTVSR